jgi:hypothetical protein
VSALHILIGCSQTKRREPAPACELYAGDLFVASLRWAQKTNGILWILSAEHGLIPASKRISPYNTTLNTAERRRVWTARVTTSLLSQTREGDRLVALAGASYCAWVRELVARGRVVEQPLAGLQIGQRKHWFAQQIAAQLSFDGGAA